METNLDTTGELKQREKVLNIFYIKIVRWLLSSVSAWPADELGRKMHWLAKCYRVYLPFQCLGIIVGELHYMVTNNLNFLELGDAILTIFLSCALLIRQVIPSLKGYREVVRDFIMDFHLMHFEHRGIHFDKVHEIVDKVCRYCTFYIAVTTFCGSMLFNVSSIYENYTNGAFSQGRKDNITHFYSAIYFNYPFYNPLEHLIAITAFNIYCSIVCGVFICLMDLLVILMAFHIIGHIVILRRNLESIVGPETSGNLMFLRKNFRILVHYEVFSEEENRKISLILKDCVDHHRVIVRFTDKMSDFFGAMLAFNYTFQLVGCCILLLESTQGDLNALIRFGPLTLIIFGQLIQISVIFEIVGTVSEKLPDSLYSIPWEALDIRNQRSVCILLHRLQRPIRVTAMGMTTVGVTTMAGILKTTFSYFAFLKSLNV